MRWYFVISINLTRVLNKILSKRSGIFLKISLDKISDILVKSIIRWCRGKFNLRIIGYHDALRHVSLSSFRTEIIIGSRDSTDRSSIENLTKGSARLNGI